MNFLKAACYVMS